MKPRRTNYIDELKKTVLEMLQKEKIRVILFGSRAKGMQRAASDIDIGLIPYGKINEQKVTLLREKIDNMNTPYKIDVVNFNEVSNEFKKEALKGAIVWKN